MVRKLIALNPNMLLTELYDGLFGLETYRHKKLGSYLMKKVEDEAIDLGATLSHTHMLTTN